MWLSTHQSVLDPLLVVIHQTASEVSGEAGFVNVLQQSLVVVQMDHLEGTHKCLHQCVCMYVCGCTYVVCVCMRIRQVCLRLYAGLCTQHNTFSLVPCTKCSAVQLIQPWTASVLYLARGSGLNMHLLRVKFLFAGRWSDDQQPS